MALYRITFNDGEVFTMVTASPEVSPVVEVDRWQNPNLTSDMIVSVEELTE